MLKGLSGKGGEPIPQGPVSWLSSLPVEVIRCCTDGLPVSLKTAPCVQEWLSAEHRTFPGQKRDPNDKGDMVFSLLLLLLLTLTPSVHTFESVSRETI